MIYTFYSYKGGVGRTMALANVAELLCRGDKDHPDGRKVLMIDWDLEAPGLEQFFFRGAALETCRTQPGIMELLAEYKNKMTRKLDLSNEDRWPFTNPLEFAQQVQRPSKKGKLWLLTPGQRSPERLAQYANRVLNFDWQDFYENWAGEVYLDWLRRQCKKFADVILIDSRTGVTEMGGVCTYHLADVVALFCAPNNQNILGTENMVNNFSQPRLHNLRGGRPLKTLIVPSRVDFDQTDYITDFRKRIARLREQSAVMEERLWIPYVSPYSFEEQIAVTHDTKSELYSLQLTEAYQGLSARLRVLGQEVRDAWEDKQNTLKNQLKKLSRIYSERLNTRVLEIDLEEKRRISADIEQIEQQRRAIGEQLERLQRELQYYLR